MSGLSRGAEKTEWGTYCRHGVKVVEAVPAVHTCHLPKVYCDLRKNLWHLCIDHQSACPACYPAGRKIKPWACVETKCREETFDEAQRAAEEEYCEAQYDAMRWAQGD